MIKKQNIKFIDLGLPSENLWGDRNFGNNKYYSWGDLQGCGKSQFGKEKIFNWDHYRFNKDNKLTKYNDSDRLRILQSEDDIVTLTLGKNYRIPRKEDFKELLKYTEKIYAENSVIFKSKINKNQIIFPLLGHAGGSSVYSAGDYCNIWSSSLHRDDPRYACRLLLLGDMEDDKMFSGLRYYGCVIRPIYYDKEK